MLVALLLLTSAYLFLPRYLPARCRLGEDSMELGVNWFGQRPAFAYFFDVIILVLLGSLRFLIIAKAASPADAVAWYLLLLASVLPAVWLLVVFDWDNEWVAPIANWVGTPVALLSVSTLFVCYDLATGTRLTGWKYVVRSLVEVAILVPAWDFFCLFCMVFLLGWVGP